MSHIALPRQRTLSAAVGAACFLAALVASSVMLQRYGLSLWDQVRFAAAVVGTVLLPGLILVRRHNFGSMPGRLGAAFTAGIGLQLLGWAGAVATGAHVLVWVVPIALALLFSFAGRFLPAPGAEEGTTSPARAGKRARSETPARAGTPWWASLTLLGVWLVILRSLSLGLWRVTPLDHSLRWYQDMYWQLSLTAEAMHRVPLTDPQSASDGTLSYHWFGNAHAAALTLSSGLGVDQVGIVAWYVPVMAALLLLVYGMAASLASSAGAGALAAVLLALPPIFFLNLRLEPGASNHFIWFSQSHIFSLPVGVLLTWLVIRALQARRLGAGSTALLVGVALLSTGSKVSLLPTVLGGVGIAALVSWGAWRFILRAAAFAVAGVVIVLATASLFAGGGGGTKYSLLPSNGIPAGMGTGYVPFYFVITAGVFLPALISLAAARRSAGPDSTTGPDSATGSAAKTGPAARPRVDPAVPVFFGMMIVALAAIFLLKHPSFSQVYFMRGIIPVACVFTAWGFAEAWTRARRASGWAAAGVVVAVSAGAAALIGWWWVHTGTAMTRTPSYGALVGMAVVVVLLGAGLAAAPRLRGRIGALAALGLAAAVLSVSLVQPVRSTTATPAAPRPAPASKPTTQSPLTPDEINGGRFLAEKNRAGELIATNVHCTAYLTVKNCDSRGFWVSSLTESPVDIGAWSYSTSARSREGLNRLPYTKQPYADAKAFQQNEAAFNRPTQAVIDALRARGVRYLYADRRASPVSPDLKRHAELLWSSPTVEIYKI